MAFAGWEAFDMEGVGSVLSDLATIRDKAGNLLVFAIGADKAVWQLSLRPGPKGKLVWKWVSLLKPDAETSLVPITNTKGLAVAQNADGRLEIFAFGTGVNSGPHGSLYRKSQTAVGGPWSAWKVFLDLFNTGIVDLQVSQNHNGGLYVFVRSEDNGLWHTGQTGPDTWSAWTELAPPADDPTGYKKTVATFVVARNAAGIQEIFTTADFKDYTGQEQWRLGQKYVWQSAQSAPDSTTWGNWVQMVEPPNYTGSYELTLRAVSLNRDGLLELFATGPDDMWELSASAVGVWQNLNWSNLGSGNVYSQGGCTVGPGWRGLEVFAWGKTFNQPNAPNAALWRIGEGHIIRIPGGHNPPNPPPPQKTKLYWDRDEWENIAGAALFEPSYPSFTPQGAIVDFKLSSGLHVSRNPDGLLDVISVGEDGTVYHNWQYP
jgi:hypothetical protein